MVCSLGGRGGVCLLMYYSSDNLKIFGVLIQKHTAAVLVAQSQR